MPEEQKRRETKTETPIPGLESMPELATLQAFGFNSMTAFGTAWVEAMSEMGAEVLSFVADRIKEDVKTQHQLLHCKDVTELQKIQARFMKDAIEQYTAETGKLVQMSQLFFPGTGQRDKS